MKTILITGAMGFIGGHTCKAFQQAGYRVIGVDRSLTIPQSSKFIDELIVDDFLIVPEIVSKKNIDGIIHIAGTSLVGPSLTNPGEYYNNNVAKTNLMLDNLSKKNWQGSIVFSSSAAVYGNNCNVPISENDEGDPVSPYGQSKKICEQIIKDHSRAHGFRSIALRYFNACGCDVDTELGNLWNDSHLIPRVVQSILENNLLTINGQDFKTKDGTCIRDYLHVSDIARAHIKAYEQSKYLDKGSFRSYNLGTGKGFSNKEIVEAVKNITGFDPIVKYGPRRAGDPDELIANPRQFIVDTGWMPINSNLDTIVETTFKWMKQYEMVVTKT